MVNGNSHEKGGRVSPIPKEGETAREAPIYTQMKKVGVEMTISEANRKENRLGKLKALAALLAREMDKVKYSKDLPPLAKQYRETIREIEEIDGDSKEEDEIGEILGQRTLDGKSRTVRKDKSKV